MLPGKVSGPKIPRSGKSIMLHIRHELKTSSRPVKLSYGTILRIVRLFFGPKMGMGKLMRIRRKTVHITGLGTFVKKDED